jgi:uncharacterized protein
VALLGILVLNVQSFSMIAAAYSNPWAYGDLTGANYAVWFITHVFFEQKFLTLFSVLFGAGIVMMTQRIEARGRSALGQHYRRAFWLIVFGLLHAHLLWYGDILFTFGMCGLVVYWFRKLPPWWLLGLGIALMAVASGIWLFGGWSLPYWSEEQITALYFQWAPWPEGIAAELACYRGSWLEQMAYRVPTAWAFETSLLLTWSAWRVGGLMLIGMALFKWGVLTAARSKRFYLGCIAAAVCVGLPTVLYGVWRNAAVNWDPLYSFFFGRQFNYWAGPLMSLGLVGLVMLWCRSTAFAWLRRALAAVGQMTLTNYLLQTVICTTIFYGHGLGMFGRVERVGQAGIVLSIWLFQLVLSPIWLTWFRFGPLEWLWRSLTYFKWQRIRR